MSIFRYSEWDGTQEFLDFDHEELMDELARNLMHDGSMSYALWKMQRQGLRDNQGRRLPGLQDLLQRLRQKKQSQLDKYKLGSVMDEIQKKLEDVVRTERQGIQKRLDEARQKVEKGAEGVDEELGQKLLKRIEDMAAQNLEKLDSLPKDVGGKVKELTDYDFMDDEARQKFQELIDMLKQHAMQSYTRDLTEKLKEMDPETLANLRHFAEAINQMLEQRMRGEEPDFEKFMEQFGDFFGPNPPQSLDELIERLQKQMAQAQSLLDSMSAEDRDSLDSLLRSMLDEATQYELAKMNANLETLYPGEKLGRQYNGHCMD